MLDWLRGRCWTTKADWTRPSAKAQTKTTTIKLFICIRAWCKENDGSLQMLLGFYCCFKVKLLSWNVSSFVTWHRRYFGTKSHFVSLIIFLHPEISPNWRQQKNETNAIDKVNQIRSAWSPWFWLRYFFLRRKSERIILQLSYFTLQPSRQ